MKIEKLYVYTGDNGVITTAVFLENVPSIKKLRLIADDGKILTNGSIEVPTIVIPESKLSAWSEIKNKGQEQLK